MKKNRAAALLALFIINSACVYCQNISVTNKKHQSFACSQHGKKCKGNHPKSSK